MANENNTYTAEDKILILAGLFHDIGKFEQRCTDTRIRHQELGERFVKEFDDQFIKILDGKQEDFEKLCTAVREHHSKNADELTQYIRQADHLSSGNEEIAEGDEDIKDYGCLHQIYLSSVLGRLRLNSEDKEENVKEKYYKQQDLSNTSFDIMMPVVIDSGNAAEYKYKEDALKKFKVDLDTIFYLYEKPEDFDTLIRLLLLYFEKYLWCVPDFTGNEETDISLYNHSKDVAAAAHALYRSEKTDDGKKMLNLVIGDIPGIQGYIFDITNTKPAKVLRGRSVFVQVLSRVFASRFLEQFGLSEVNVIMLAGGKFYILAPSHNKFDDQFGKALCWCEEYMKENFNYELSFSAGYAQFDPEKLKNKEGISFGDIVEEASHNLLERRSRVFSKEFLSENFKPVLDVKYIGEGGAESDDIKCAVSGKPIRKGREEEHDEQDENSDNRKRFRDKQAGNELKLGESIVYGTTVITYSDYFREIVDDVRELKNMPKEIKPGRRIIINPDYEKFSSYMGDKAEIIRGAYFLHVANYASLEGGGVMPFDKMEEQNQGAKLLTMIKGDIDNLGLLMATGLYSDGKDYTGFSRTTSLSYHLRYFFSTFFNNFLKEWEKSGDPERKVYTVFAGGDDLLFITPHGSSLELLRQINKKFTEFTCTNPEVHISYSLTNFKHNTPVRLVNDFAEENQAKSKNKKTKIDLDDAGCFYAEKNKASVVLHDTVVKTSQADEVIELTNDLMRWVKSEEVPVSMGIIRSMLTLSGVMQEYLKTGKTEKLMFYPQLTYLINRLMKDGSGNYKVSNPTELEKVAKLFDTALDISKSKEQKIEFFSRLTPALCEAIYKLRTSGDNHE